MNQTNLSQGTSITPSPRKPRGRVYSGSKQLDPETFQAIVSQAFDPSRKLVIDAFNVLLKESNSFKKVADIFQQHPFGYFLLRKWVKLCHAQIDKPFDPDQFLDAASIVCVLGQFKLSEFIKKQKQKEQQDPQESLHIDQYYSMENILQRWNKQKCITGDELLVLFNYACEALSLHPATTWQRLSETQKKQLESQWGLPNFVIPIWQLAYQQTTITDQAQSPLGNDYKLCAALFYWIEGLQQCYNNEQLYKLNVRAAKIAHLDLKTFYVNLQKHFLYCVKDNAVHPALIQKWLNAMLTEPRSAVASKPASTSKPQTQTASKTKIAQPKKTTKPTHSHFTQWQQLVAKQIEHKLSDCSYHFFLLQKVQGKTKAILIKDGKTKVFPCPEKLTQKAFCAYINEKTTQTIQQHIPYINKPGVISGMHWQSEAVVLIYIHCNKPQAQEQSYKLATKLMEKASSSLQKLHNIPFASKGRSDA